MEKIYNRLVRDRIPSILEGLGEHPTYKKLDEASFKRELLKALLEESNAVISSRGKEHKKEALADLIEVVSCICKEEGTSLREMIAYSEEKSYIKGGYQDHIYLVKTGKKEE